MRTRNAALEWARDHLGVYKSSFTAPFKPIAGGNWCCYFATEAVGSTVGVRTNIENGSIRSLRGGQRKWKEGKTAKVGALVLLRWSGSGLPDHIGIVHTVYPDKSVGTYEGNTGPRVGQLTPNGAYSRRRYPANIVGYIYPPYAAASAAKH